MGVLLNWFDVESTQKTDLTRASSLSVEPNMLGFEFFMLREFEVRFRVRGRRLEMSEILQVMV